jgi:hypothetical protein
LSKTSPGRRASGRASLGLALCGIVVCLVFGWQGVQAAHPFLLASRLRNDNDQVEREILRLRLQNQRAIKEIKVLETPQGVEREARKLGWVLPKEQRLRIPQP